MWPVRQCSQWPQKGVRQVTTWSPTFTVRTSVAHRLDHAGRLVAQHRRQRVLVGALDEMQVGVADAGGPGADQHLARAGPGDRDLLDLKRLADLAQDRSLHWAASGRAFGLGGTIGMDEVRPPSTAMAWPLT